MWEGIAELVGEGSLSQGVLVQCLFHLVLTTLWAPINAVLSLYLQPPRLVTVGLAEVILVLALWPSGGFLLWEVAAIVFSLILSYGWVYYERPHKWDRIGFPMGAFLAALGINGIIALATLL